MLGEGSLKSDLIHRTVGIGELAAADVERTDEPTRRVVEAFARGINRQIEAGGRELPIEFVLLEYEPEPFTAHDVIAILRGMWWSLNGRLEGLVCFNHSRNVFCASP